MPADAPFTPPRKKPNVLWWIGAALLLLLGMFFFQLFGPNSPIVVSKETTYITEPLRPNGLPDYERYLVDKSRQGIAGDNNAAKLLWQALWPGELEPLQYEAMYIELGLAEVPSTDDALQSVDNTTNRDDIQSWLVGQSGTEIREDTAEQILDLATKSPWNTNQLPPLAEWIKHNQQPLDLIVEASMRPRYYSPSPTLIDDRHDMVLESWLPGAASIRVAARSLSTRAMWHIGEDQPAEAWQDLIAIHRLSRLLGKSPFLVEHAISFNVAAIACEGTAALLGQDSLTNHQSELVLHDLMFLDSFSNVDDGLNSDRLMYLDCIIHMHSGTLTEAPRIGLLSANWNQALRDGNKWHDRIIGATRITNYIDRKQALDAIESDLRLLETTKAKDLRFRNLLSRQSRSEVFSANFVSRMMPNFHAVMRSQDLANTLLDLIRVAAALAVYRAEQGEYPAALDALVPNILVELPTDLYTIQPFRYKRAEDSYLLYSVGENGIDDGGSHEQYNKLQGRDIAEVDESEPQDWGSKIPADADDISIRVPRPAFKLPEFESPPDVADP